jgi:hypothetical protein
MKSVFRSLSKGTMVMFMSVFILSSCADSQKEETIKEQTELSFFNKSYPYYNYSYGKFDLNNFNSEAIIKSNLLTLNEGNFEDLKNKLVSLYDIKQSDSDNYVAITFYDNDINLNINNSITGFSILKSNNDGYYLENYRLEDDKVVLLKKYSKKYSAILVDFFGFLSVKTDIGNNSFLTIIKEKKEDGINLEARTYTTDPKIDLALLEQYPIIFARSSGHFCTQVGCGTTARGFCAFVDGNKDVTCERSDYVEDNECADDDTHEDVPEHEQEESITQGKAAMHFIRDNILAATFKGNEYIDYYYKVSYVLKVNDSYTANRTELKELFALIHRKAILFITANNNTIIIDNNEATYLKSLIDKYRLISNNEEYQFIFDKFESDLEALKNKNKGFITTYIQ